MAAPSPAATPSLAATGGGPSADGDHGDPMGRRCFIGSHRWWRPLAIQPSCGPSDPSTCLGRCDCEPFVEVGWTRRNADWRSSQQKHFGCHCDALRPEGFGRGVVRPSSTRAALRTRGCAPRPDWSGVVAAPTLGFWCSSARVCRSQAKACAAWRRARRRPSRSSTLRCAKKSGLDALGIPLLKSTETKHSR